MYRRYSPVQQQKPQINQVPIHNRPNNTQPLKGTVQTQQKPKPVKKETDNIPKKQRIANPIFNFIPSSVYNPETKKVFGVLSPEDLLIAAMILLLLENEEKENNILAYALLYVLISDYIDLPL